MTRADIASLFESRITALNDHDVHAFGATYADDAVVESPLGGTHQGRAAIAGVVDIFLAALSDATFTGGHLIIDGDRVVQVFTLSGTDTGGLMGMAPSGRPAQLPMVIVCRVADGLVVHERRIYDFTGMRANRRAEGETRIETTFASGCSARRAPSHRRSAAPPARSRAPIREATAGPHRSARASSVKPRPGYATRRTPPLRG